MNCSIDIQQRAAFEKLSRLKAGALFMVPGTGKTKIALDLAISRQHDYDIVVWISDASLINDGDYIAEINRWSGELQRPIEYFTIEGVSQSDRQFLHLHNIAKNNRVFCIVDESLSIKNAVAKRTARLLAMWNLFEFRLILNGTPLTKGLIDLYSQIQFIHPHILNMTESQFADKFLIYAEDGYRPWTRWSKPANEEALIEIIRPYIYDSDLDVTCKLNENRVVVHLADSERMAYEEYKRAFLSDKFEVEFLTVTQAFQHFYTACRDKRRSANKIYEQVRSRGEKVAIYVKFLYEINILREMFPHAVVYTGIEKQNIERLRGGSDVLLCTYGVGSKGKNWQFMNNVIFFSQTFDYGAVKQATHRFYRNGQTRDVNVYSLWIEHVGLEDLMQASQDKKVETASHVSRIISRKEALSL